MKNITIDQFLTVDEINQAVELYRKIGSTGKFASTVDAEIIRPNIERINKALGQENDPRYLAYAVEYVLGETAKLSGQDGRSSEWVQ